jgi:hypothetical protein
MIYRVSDKFKVRGARLSKMKRVAEQFSSILVIIIALSATIYLLTLSSPTGDPVDINERWFEYGKASAPVVKSDNDAPLAHGVLAPAERDENDEIFYWITEYGDVIAISNLSEVTHTARLTFEVTNNPCKNERNLVIGNKSEQLIITSPKKGSASYAMDILVEPLSTEFFSITPLPGLICNLNNSDDRNFVTKISKINLDIQNK